MIMVHSEQYYKSSEMFTGDICPEVFPKYTPRQRGWLA